MLIHNAVLTGSFSYAGADLSNISASADYSASLSTRTTNLETASGSFSTRLTAVSSSQQQISSSLLQVSASYIALSGSYNIFSGSASTRITTVSSSQQDISSSQQQISASLLNVIATGATTGSNSFRADQSITGSLVVSSTITAQTLVVQTVTSSIVYSSGSNNFGNQLANTQTFTGSVNITGSLAIAGNITSNGAAVVLGSGTSGYLPKFTGTSAVGNSLVYDNGTSVVIGTATPATNYILTLRTQLADYTKVLDWGTAAGGSWGNMTINTSAPYQTILNSGAWQFNISGTQKMLLDASGNLGLGVTPSAWSLGTALEIANGAAILGFNNETFIASNAYYDGGWKYRASYYAQSYFMNGGEHKWQIAPSGSANAAITFTQAMTLTAAGELLINTTSDAGDWKLQVNGSAYFTNTNSVGYTYVTIGNSGASGRSYDIGVGGNGVGSPYQNSFYVFDNVAGQPRFYIASTGAATFSSSVTAGGTINASDYIQAARSSGGYLMGISNTADADLQFTLTASGAATKYASIGGSGATNLVLVPNGGNVGINNTNPQTKLNVTATSATTSATVLTIDGGATGFNNANDANTGYSINFDGCSYSTAAGIVQRTGAQIQMLKEGTWNEGQGASGTYGSLVFKTNNGTIASPSLTERMRITSGGELRITGAGSSQIPFSIYDGASRRVFCIPSQYYGYIFAISVAADGGKGISFGNGGGATEVGSIVCNNASTTYNTTSDYRLKEDLKDFNGLNKISAIKVYDFKWKSNEERTNGVLAHELAEVLPYAVHGEKDGLGRDGNPSYQGVDYSKIVPTLVKAIQELKAELDTAKAEITELKNK